MNKRAHALLEITTGGGSGVCDVRTRLHGFHQPPESQVAARLSHRHVPPVELVKKWEGGKEETKASERSRTKKEDKRVGLCQ